MLKDPTPLVEAARKRNECRVKNELRLGFMPPERDSFARLAEIARKAIWTGLCTEDWDSVAEAFVLVEQLEKSLKIRAEMLK